jgi:hypothetical protein
MFCGPGPGHEEVEQFIEEVPLTVDPTGWRIRDEAVGKEYDLWGSSKELRDSDCGLGNDFKGVVDYDDGPFEIPGEWDAGHGVSSGHTVVSPLTDGCDLPAGTKFHSIEEGCKFAVPICVEALSATSLKCVKVGVFEVSSVHSSLIKAIFLGGGLYRGGEAGGVATSAAGPLVIKLVE